MKKRIRYGILGLTVVFLVLGINYGLKYAFIGSSYASKIVCSCHFIAGRELEDIRQHDLYAVPFASIDIDEVNKTVSSSIYGMAKTTAVYREGIGCTLANEPEAKSLKKEHVVIPRNPVIHRFPEAPRSTYFDSAALEAVIEPTFVDDPKMPLQTRAVVIIKDGNLVYEKYGQGYSRDSKLMGWSMTKSVTNAMVGLMVKDGKLHLEQKNLLPDWLNDERKDIALTDLLHMSSGLEFVEDYSSPSDATRMLFRARAAGVYAIQSLPKYKPGEKFYYSSGTSNILQEIIRRQFASHADYLRFPYARLFDKIGMAGAVLEADRSGTYVGSSFMYATALDWARFGQLYLQDGVWNGERILPEGWASYSGTESPNSSGRYAAHFWKGSFDKDFPADAYIADGFEGQFVTIIPSRNMVVVRLGCTYGQEFDNIRFVNNILRTLK
jgi:CubicO group peptidase (beta-lactamase class C family)